MSAERMECVNEVMPMAHLRELSVEVPSMAQKDSLLSTIYGAVHRLVGNLDSLVVTLTHRGSS